MGGCPDWGEGVLEKTVVVGPKELAYLGTVRPLVDGDAAPLGLGFAWKHVRLTAEDYSHDMAAFDNEIAACVARMRQHGITVAELGSAGDIEEACSNAQLV